MTPTPDQIATTLAAALPPEQRHVAPALAALLAALADDPVGASNAASPDVVAALRALAGSSLPSGGSLISFGEEAQLGDVTVGDVASGSIVKLSIPITQSETTTQSITAGAGGTISQVVQLKIDGSGHTIILGGGNANPAAVAPPAATPALADGATIFLAEGGTHSPALDALAMQLRLRGLRVWREPDLGDLTRRAYDAALATIDAAVVALTPDSCESDRLVRVEMPAIWARFAQPAPFWIVPLIAGVGERAAERTISAGGLRLSDLRVFALTGAAPERAAQIADLARLVLRNVALPHLRQSAARDGAVELRLFTHRAGGDTGRADLVLDWGALFGTREAPLWSGPAEWSSQLLPALADVRELIGASGTPRLRIDGRFHLSAAYALGHQFAATAGIELEVKSTTSPEWWGLDRSGVVGAALKLGELTTGDAGAEVTVEISLAQDARADVTAYLARHPLPLARRVQLTSPPVEARDVIQARSFVASPAHALKLANQIAGAILLEKGASTVHLFGPLSQALAVLVGQRLNTARPLQCYEYVRETAAYVPACLLR